MERQYKYKSRYTANWDRVPLIEGRVTDRGSMSIEKRTRAYIKVETADGEVTVFESAGLADLFKAVAVGDFVMIEFLAVVPTKAGRTFRQFRASCWTEADAEPILARSPRRRKVAREPRTKG